MYIRDAAESDLKDVLSIESAAFDHDKEAVLVTALLDDHSAKPVLSLLAFKNGRAVGHILFTTAQLADTKDTALIVILAPLAILPDALNKLEHWRE